MCSSDISVTADVATFESRVRAALRGEHPQWPLYDPEEHASQLLSDYGFQILDNVPAGRWSLPDIDARKVLLVVEGSPFAKWSEFAAVALGAVVRRVTSIDAMPDELHDARAAILLVHPEDAVDGRLQRSYQSCLALAPTGIISSPDLAHLSWFLVKQALKRDRDGHLVLLPRSNRPSIAAPAGVEVITGAVEQMVERTRAALRVPLETFAVSAHGAEDVLSLSDGVVCAKSAFRISRSMPCTVGVDCPLGKTGINVADIDARVVLVNSCMGFRPHDSVLPREANLTTSLLEAHAVAVVAAGQVKYGPDGELCVLHNLLRAGASLGVAVQAVHSWLSSTDFDVSAFVLAGDPDLMLADIVPATTSTVSELGTFTLTADGRSSLAMLHIGDALEPAGVDVRPSKGATWAVVRHTAFGPARRLLIASWEAFPAGDSTVHLEGEVVSRAWPQLDVSRWSSSMVRWAYDAMPSGLSAIHNAADQLAIHSSSASHDATSAPRVRKAVARLTESLRSLQTEQLRKILVRARTDGSVWLPEHYHDRVTFETSSDEIDCFVCGRPAVVRRCTHRVTGERRRSVNCVRCGGVSDLPDESAANVRVDAPSVVSVGDLIVCTSQVVNTGTDVMRGCAGIAIDSTARHGVVAKDEIIEFVLEPGETAHVSARVQLTDRVPAHLYHAKLLFFDHLDLGYAHAPMFVAAAVPHDELTPLTSSDSLVAETS